jgi:hypothetical protein
MHHRIASADDALVENYVGQSIVDYIIKSRSEFFCAKPKDRGPRRGRGRDNWAKHKRPSTLKYTIIFYTR